MQHHIVQYFEKDEMISLSESPDLRWAKKKAPRLTKGWFELSKLEPMIRLEFIRDYWFNPLPYVPIFRAFLDCFFTGVEEVGIVAVKNAIYLTYSLRGRREFFLGDPPLVDDEIAILKRQIDFPLPEDFLKFFRIHNGFLKGGDTGIYSSGVLAEEAERFKELESPLKLGSEVVSPDLSLPFYRSFGLDVYQCFYKDWYPDGEVGNVLCSLKRKDHFRLLDPRKRERLSGISLLFRVAKLLLRRG